MNRKQKKRFFAIVGILVVLAIAAGLVLYALKQNINLFYTPTELSQASVTATQNLRIGGYVKNKSVHYDASGKTANFIVTDHKNDISVKFDGVLPSLFREGQVVVITGKLSAENIFLADQVLAKHDEKYMPKQLEKTLKRGSQNGT